MINKKMNLLYISEPKLDSSVLKKKHIATWKDNELAYMGEPTGKNAH